MNLKKIKNKIKKMIPTVSDIIGSYIIGYIASLLNFSILTLRKYNVKYEDNDDFIVKLLVGSKDNLVYNFNTLYHEYYQKTNLSTVNMIDAILVQNKNIGCVLNDLCRISLTYLVKLEPFLDDIYAKRDLPENRLLEDILEITKNNIDLIENELLLTNKPCCACDNKPYNPNENVFS